MAELNELLEKRASLAKELDGLDGTIKEMTDLPYGWEIDSGHGHMAGGVTLWGSVDDGDGRREQVSICAYSGSQGSGFFIKDHERGTESPHVDREAVKAALRILDIKDAEWKKKMDEDRAERERKRGV